MKSRLANKVAFTLIEFLVTVLVLSIIIVIAMPAISTILMNSRLTANMDMFLNALNYARSTALNQSSNVVVCPFGVAKSTNCGTNWGSGWIVVTQPSSGVNMLLQSQQFSSTDPKLSSTSASVVFDPHGLITTPSNFTFCDSRGGTFARSIEVLATGYIQSGPTSGQAVWDNSTLACP